MSDDSRHDSREPRWPKILVYGAALYAIAGGLTTLFGWSLARPRLTDWIGDGISMFPNTAICAVLSGIALLVSTTRRRTPTAWVGGMVAIVAGATLLEHLTSWNFGIDTALFQHSWGQAAAVAPMRMGPPASVSFLLVGVSFLLARGGHGSRSIGAGCGVVALAIAMLSLTGRLYGAEQMYAIPTLTGIALPTASILALLGLGLIASTPDVEPMGSLLEPGAAGVLVRRALPIVVLTALALGWVRVTLQNQGLVDTAFGTALRTLVEIGLLAGLLWWAARTVRAHERALRNSETEVVRQASQLTAFLETAAIGIHRVGPDGTILWVNDAELATLGYSRDEYVGHSISEFHADQRVIGDILERLHRGEKLLQYPAQMRCKDGSLKSVLIDSSVLWEGERFVHTQSFTRDVTSQRSAEELRSLLAAIVEASDDAVISKTLDGIITSWNAGASRIFGYSADEAIGRSIELLIPPDRLDEEREILRRLRRGERVDHYETKRRTKDGEILDISLTSSPVRDASGRITGASKIARNVTERKRFEAEREDHNRRKDEFIAILAHELRNPLAPVRNAARYLKIRGLDRVDFKRPIDIIERQVAQMSRLIDDLLDVSRISRGMLELRPERVACAEVLEAAVEVCRDDLEAKRHQLTVSVPPEPVHLEADRERLVQIFCNLISNAVKYTPVGGRIDVTITVPTPKTLGISVKDNGIGIPAAKQEEIFDLFARVDHSLERQGGLGIGLTLVRQLVNLHGGHIEARSQGIGHGSEFLAELPIVVTSPAPRESQSETRPTTPPLRIVVADDNEDAAESLTLLLGMSGHDAYGVHDGAAALTAIEEHRPQVALVDIGMPKANGYEVARRVREAPWGKAVYLVALTGWGQEADKHRAQEAGFDAHLVKPVDPETLDRLLSSVAAIRPQ